jgi:hypothetical protein
MSIKIKEGEEGLEKMDEEIEKKRKGTREKIKGSERKETKIDRGSIKGKGQVWGRF